jgi:4-amino-4-deoxy-L-arabinose transferase-like glycosyltransferase
LNLKNYLIVWNKFPRLSLLCVTLPLLLLNSHHQSLLAYDEGYYADQARWIWETGDWLTPQWWGAPIYDRTIGIQWLIALAYHLFGLNEFSARLPSAIACILSILLTYEIGKILFNRQIAWLGALMLMFMALWVLEVHMATQNTALVTVELLGIWAILHITDRQLINLSSSKIVNWGWGIMAGMSVGLGFIVKGFMIFVPIVALFPYLLFQQRYRRLITNPGVYLGLIFGAIPTILWLTLSYQKYGIMPVQNLVTKLLFLSKTDIYNPSPFYYLWNLPANIFPWAFFSIIGAFIISNKLLLNINYLAISMTLGYPISLFILLSLFQTRMPYYTVQLLPFMALLAATAFVKFTQISRNLSPQWYRFVTWLSYAFSGLGVVLAIGGILVMTNRQIGGITITSEIQKYAISAVILGCGWTSIIILWRRWQPPSVPYWLASWLVPAWFTIASFGLEGAWTDKSPDFIAAIHQPKIHSALIDKPVNLLIDIASDTGSRIAQYQERSFNGEELKTLILLTFYTPHLGQKITSFNSLPDRSYAWTLNISPQLATRTRTIGKVSGWQLIQKIS